MVIGMIVQAVSGKQGDPNKSTTTSSASSSVNHNTSTSTTPPIPKSPSYHSNLDQAGGKEFSFTKASLEAVVRTPSLSNNVLVDHDHEQQYNQQLNPFTNMGSPLRPRDRNAYNAPPANVQNLAALKGALYLHAQQVQLITL